MLPHVSQRGLFRRLPVATFSLRPSQHVNSELVVGDGIALVVTCLYRQIVHVVSSPDFPGWTSPLQFNAHHVIDFASFLLTVTSSWLGSGLLLSQYNPVNLPQAIRTCSVTWLFSMPIAASQLVLSTAVENQTLVGEEGWVSLLPLPATGPGEPFVSASLLLGVMAIWRCFYITYIYQFSLVDERTAEEFDRTLVMVAGLSLLGSLILLGLDRLTRIDDL